MIASLVKDAAPGEIDAVKHDIEVFTGKNNSIQKQLAENIKEANIDQLRIVEVKNKLTVISKHNKINDTTFFTHGSEPLEFNIDHLTRKTEVVGKYELEDVDLDLLTKIQKQVDIYAKQHYEGEYVSAVFPTKKDNQFKIILVGRRLSPQNFHNGQISCDYTLDGQKLSGIISVDVHFFEDGNVRLKSSHPVNGEVKSGNLGETLLTVEDEFENSLNKTLVNLNEREFKGLRRQLPVTRQPMTWGQAVAGYKLGKELENR